MTALIVGRTETQKGNLYTILYKDTKTTGYKACLCLCSECLHVEKEVDITRPFKGWCNIIKK